MLRKYQIVTLKNKKVSRILFHQLFFLFINKNKVKKLNLREYLHIKIKIILKT